ncbi:MAG: hypothetical protein CSA24_00610 [Deltaproteobacteria bacterium]|nr:MAG: hypothetical protein CSB49_06095 [Pseudomonadota bacterium]PIE66246.1 MAG: hypothetical protein CSA24_00610 [Deltaproteobacteria bacterium]
MRLRVLWPWAAREALRRPGEMALSGLCLAATVIVLGSGLLLAGGLERTTTDLLQSAPSLVLRRVDSAGWQPMPAEALARARRVRGVTRAEARLWGTVRAGERAVTLVGGATLPSNTDVRAASRPAGTRYPSAVVGPALGLAPGDFLTLEGRVRRTFRVSAATAAEHGLIAHDLVRVAPDQARALLGLPAGASSDLALWVFHDSEMTAIRPDLAKALGFPLRITTRAESLAAARATIAKRAGVRTLVAVPLLLALALLTLATVRQQLASRRDVGLLKALGWGSRDVLALHLARALVIGLPALALGWAVAYALVFVGGAGWAGQLLLGWSGAPPQLTLDPTGALLTLLEVAGLVVAPWLAAVLLPALRSSTADPETWLRGEQP